MGNKAMTMKTTRASPVVPRSGSAWSPEKESRKAKSDFEAKQETVCLSREQCHMSPSEHSCRPDISWMTGWKPDTVPRDRSRRETTSRLTQRPPAALSRLWISRVRPANSGNLDFGIVYYCTFPDSVRPCPVIAGVLRERRDRSLYKPVLSRPSAPPPPSLALPRERHKPLVWPRLQHRDPYPRPNMHDQGRRPANRRLWLVLRARQCQVLEHLRCHKP